MSNRKNRLDSGKYKAAIIGCGGIGYLYDRNRRLEGALTHFSAFEKAKDFELVAVCDTDTAILEEIGNRFGKRGYGDYTEMLERESPLDVVVVATPDETHESILRGILPYRPRLVFAEKPLATSHGEVNSLIEEFRRAGVGLLVNFYRRYTRELQELREDIVSGNLGDVQSVTIYYSRGFFHNCCHFLDLLDWYFGRPGEVHCLGTREGLHREDPTRTLLMRYPNQMEVHLIGLPASRLLSYEVDIFAGKGRVRILHHGAIEQYTVAPNPVWPEFSCYKLEREKHIDFAGALPQAVDNIKAWLDGREELRSPGENSTLVFEIMEMAKEIDSCPT